MPTSAVLNPKITSAGQAAAIAQDGLGLQLSITHVAFGTGAYNPLGSETELDTEVKRVTLPAGALVTPTQLRLTAIWESDTDDFPINEIGFFAGATLFAVWSRAAGGPIGYKTPGVDFVLFHDLKISGVPAGSITIQVEETAGSVALAALGSHEAAPDPHPQYVLESAFPDANALLACAVAGTANAIVLTPPMGVEVPAYATYQKFAFIAGAENTGAVTANVATRGVKNVKKGADALVAGDIKAGGYYELVYDGTSLQISGGVGGGATLETFRFVATGGQTAFTGNDADGKTLAYVPGLALVFRAGALVPFTGADGVTITLGSGATAGDEVVISAFGSFTVADAVLRSGDTMAGALALAAGSTAPTPAQFDNDTSVATTAFVRSELLGLGNAAYDAVFGKSFASNGYQKLPSGLIVQWGSVITSASAGVAATFPLAFPNALLNITMSAAQNASYHATFDTITNAGIVINGWVTMTGARVSFNSAFWVAIGH